MFDSGSRPAELFLLLGARGYNPAAYKVGVFALCTLVPLAVAVSALAAGLNRAGAALASLLACLVWWGEPARMALKEGQIDLLLAALAALTQVGLLIRFDKSPGPLTWVGLVVSGYLGWFSHPLFFALGLPLALVYYLSVGPRHQLFWHLALLVGLAGALACHGFWLLEWVKSWWIQAPVDTHPLEAQALLRQSSLIWDARLLGPVRDQVLAVILGIFGLLGVVLFNQTRQRPAARLLGLGTAGFVLLALAGTVWQPLASFGTRALIVPALLFAILPAVFALGKVSCWVGRTVGGPRRGAVLVGTTVLTLSIGGGLLAEGNVRAPSTAPNKRGRAPSPRANRRSRFHLRSDLAKIAWPSWVFSASTQRARPGFSGKTSTHPRPRGVGRHCCPS